MLYFAYGSNLNKKEMKMRCPNSRPMGVLTLKDWQLMFRVYLTIEPKEGMEVPIAVWNVPEEDMKALDEYEGYPHLYKKEKMTIGGHEGIIYIMNESTIPYALPKNSYFNRCVIGYINFGFDRKELERALNRTFKEMKIREMYE